VGGVCGFYCLGCSDVTRDMDYCWIDAESFVLDMVSKLV
jgi:hypothetical protein